MVKTVLTVFLTAASASIVTLVVLRAQPRVQEPTLTAMDYVEIQQLYARYAYGFDSGNGDLYASVFTTDGVFKNDTMTFTGSRELADFARGSGNKLPTAVNHFITNVLIEPSPEGAHGRAYLMIVNNNDPNAARGGGISTRGMYDDALVKTPQGWRIKNRVFTNRDNRPPAAVAAPQPTQPR